MKTEIGIIKRTKTGRISKDTVYYDVDEFMSLIEPEKPESIEFDKLSIDLSWKRMPKFVWAMLTRPSKELRQIALHFTTLGYNVASNKYQRNMAILAEAGERGRELLNRTGTKKADKE